MRARAPKHIIMLVDDAIAAAKMESCGVASEHKAAMKLYIDTWVIGRLTTVRDYLIGEIDVETARHERMS